jgi:hypothetical protein
MKRYEELHSAEAAALERSDPKAFATLRADWVKRGEPEFGGPKELPLETVVAIKAAAAAPSADPQLTHEGKVYEHLAWHEVPALEQADPEKAKAMVAQRDRHEREFERAFTDAIHGGRLTAVGRDALYAQVERGEITFRQATHVVNALPAPKGAA